MTLSYASPLVPCLDGMKVREYRLFAFKEMKPNLLKAGLTQSVDPAL